jgi:hypothetical protein
MYKLWRQENPILDEEGLVIKGGMWKHQRIWWKTKNYIKAMVAGYGSGKTFIGAKRAISLAILNRGQPHFWVSPSYKVAKRTVVPTLIELLEGKKSLEKGFNYKFNKTDNEFRINHRGRKGVIWIGSGDEPDSLKGPTVASATIDEPFIQDKGVFNQILARVRSPKAIHREIGLLGTPEQLNWGYDICEGDEKKNFDIAVMHVSTAENKSLPKEYLESLLRGYTDKMRQAFLQGLFVNLSKGAIYYGFSKERNVIELPDPGHDLCAGMDFNVNPMAAMVFWKHAQHMHVVSEIEIENADTEYMATILEQDNSTSDCSEYLRGQILNFLFDDGTRRVQTVYPDPTGKSRHTSSPGGQSDFTILRGDNFDRFELIAKIGSPRIRDRENAVNGKLNPVKGTPTLTIDPRCTKLIQYLLAYTHELRNKQKQMSHLIDALGYPVDYLYPITKPRIVVKQVMGH